MVCMLHCLGGVEGVPFRRGRTLDTSRTTAVVAFGLSVSSLVILGIARTPAPPSFFFFFSLRDSTSSKGRLCDGRGRGVSF